MSTEAGIRIVYSSSTLTTRPLHRASLFNFDCPGSNVAVFETDSERRFVINVPNGLFALVIGARKSCSDLKEEDYWA